MIPSPRVSVLIPTYNRAQYIAGAIRSVLSQTFSDLEVIVVDDGSTDATADIVRGIADPRVRYLYQPHRGVSAALNTAWRAARAPYLAEVGSDDVMLPDQLQVLAPLLDGDPAAALAYARAQAMDVNGNPLPQILGAPEKFPGESLKSILYGDCICGIACVYRRACIERAGGFDETMIGNEDWDLWIRMAALGRFIYRDQILARYRIHANSLTGSRSDTYVRIVLDRARLIENYYAQPDVPPAARQVEALARRNVYMDVMIRLLAIGRRRAALPYFWRAVRSTSNPFAATARVIAVALFDLYLSKTRWGVRLVDAVVTRRRPRPRAADG